MNHQEIAQNLYEALNNLRTETLGKIADGFNIPGNWYRQGTWDKCIFNQISGGTSFESCANTLTEDKEAVRKVIQYWDNLKGRNPNRTLREFIIKIMHERGILVETILNPQTHVVSVETKTLFESTMIPAALNFDALEDIPLVTESEVDNFLQGLMQDV